MAFEFLESLRQVSSAMFSMKQSEATIVGFVDPSKYDLVEVITEIVGSAEPMGDGRIDRVLPLAHPQYPWLFAESVSVSGVAFDSKVAADPTLEAPSIPGYAKYQMYKLDIKFTGRPYAILSNDSIGQLGTVWYDDAGESRQNNYAQEWQRFMEYDDNPSAEYIRADQGQYKFQCLGAADAQNPNNATVPGQVKIIQRKSTIKMRWHQVPLEFVDTDSDEIFLYDCLGHINQADWYGFKAGTLLFQAISYTRYVPVNPGFDPWVGPSIVSAKKLVDIEMTFLRYEPITDPRYPPPPVIGNNVAGGHNLLPWLANGGRGSFYVEHTITKQSVYPSYPFELLFTDPNV